MELSLNIGQTTNLGNTIQDLTTSTGAASSSIAGCNFTGAYSVAPGLNQLARSHADVLHSGIGSAQKVLDSYREQVEWLKNSLDASRKAIASQDDCMAQALQTDRCTVPDASVDAAAFPARPDTRYDNFVFNRPFVMGVAPIRTTLQKFESTNTGMVEHAAAQWRQVAQEIDTIAHSLDDIAAEVVAVNKGEVFDAAAERISDTAKVGHNFAANAQTMASSVASLNEINAWAVDHLRAAEAELNLIPDPAMRASAEEIFMLGFMNVALPAAAQQGVPPINNLTNTPPEAATGPSTADVGMTQTATAGVPLDAAGLPGFLSNAGKAIGAAHTLAGAANGIAQGLGAQGLGAFGAAGPGSFQAIMQAGHNIAAGNPASAAAGGVGGLGTLQRLGGAGTGAGLSAAAGGLPAGAGRSGASLSPVAPFGLGAGGATTGGGNPAIGGARGAQQPRNLSTTATSAHNNAHPGFFPGAPLGGAKTKMQPGRNSARSTLNPAAGMNAGRGAGGGAGGQAFGPHGGAAGFGAGGYDNRGVTGAPGAGLVGGNISGAGAGVGVGARGGASGMMPMGGMPMGAAGQGKHNPKSAKAVTSAVEAEGNVAELLGEPPRAVPGVIGDWVRD